MSDLERKFKILIPIAAIFSVLFIFEIFFRLRELVPRQNWYQRQSLLEKSSFPLFNELCADNVKGLGHINQIYADYNFLIRDFHYDKEKPAGTFRILGTGDSFAWGWGVRNHIYIYFKRLECWFSKEKRAQKIEVINGAQPAWNTWDEENFLLSSGFAFNPDLILLQFNLNDAAQFHGMVPFDAWAYQRQQKRENFFFRISKLYEYIDLRVTSAIVHRWTLKNYHEAYLGNNQNLWKKCQQSILNIALECNKRRIKLLVQIFPLLYNLEAKKYEFAREVAVVESFLKRNGIRCHNMLPDFMGKSSSSLWSLPTDTHPNERGHQIAAESTYRYLISHGLIPAIIK